MNDKAQMLDVKPLNRRGRGRGISWAQILHRIFVSNTTPRTTASDFNNVHASTGVLATQLPSETIEIPFCKSTSTAEIR